VLPNVLSSLGLEQRRAETEIVKVWNHLLDPNIVAHAQPAGLRKGTLFVDVDSSVWLNEIVRYRRREILERLQHSFGRALITKISFRVS
jgi:predicted nucleic acid-binding Zn ribbon protein